MPESLIGELRVTKIEFSEIYQQYKIIQFGQPQQNRVFYHKINHYSQITYISENSLISGAAYPNIGYIQSTIITGFILPEAFPFLDTHGYIQNKNKIPIIYHSLRIRILTKESFTILTWTAMIHHTYFGDSTKQYPIRTRKRQ